MGEVIDVSRFRDLMPDGALLYGASFSRGLRPPPALRLWQWADKYRRLSGVASAEDGRWRTARTPYLREPMEHLSPSHPAQWVRIRKAAQLGATETGNNWVGFFVDVLGGAMLCVQPTVEMAKRWSKQRLAPLLRDTPRIAKRVKTARARDSGNTLMSKEFVGGIVLITGANSAIGLRSMPAQWLFFDEVDAYPDVVGGEGHPIDVAWFRSATFHFRKVLEISTPIVRHASRIDDDVERSDGAYYYVPCLSCSEYQRLEADRLIYPQEDPGSCRGMACIACGSIMPEGKKTVMLAEGRWHRFDVESNKWIHRPLVGLDSGFSISQLYSPIGLGLTWGEIATQREAARNDESAARTYANLVLGESYEEKSDAPEWKLLYERRQDYPLGIVPAGAYVLVGSADVQRDRIEVAWHAFGPEFEGWLVDHVVLEGDTSADDVWRQLTVTQQRAFPHTEGSIKLPSDLFLIDMQYQTEQVKLWVRRQRSPRRVRAVQGSESWGAPAVIGRSQTDLTSRGEKKKLRRGFSFWRISTATLKLEIYRRLRRDQPAGGTMPFGGPWLHHPQVSEEWMQQLTAEHLVRRRVVGSRHRSRLMFEKVRERNEALDLTVYNVGGAYMLKVEQLTDLAWDRYRARWKMAQEPPPTSPGGKSLPNETKRRSRRANWVTGR